MKIALTGGDIADLIIGASFDAIDKKGNEVILYGDDFSDDELRALLAGQTVSNEDYEISAPEPVWNGHHGDEDSKLLKERLAELTRDGETMALAEVKVEPGQRQRLSLLAEDEV